MGTFADARYVIVSVLFFFLCWNNNEVLMLLEPVAVDVFVRVLPLYAFFTIVFTHLLYEFSFITSHYLT